MMGRAMSARRTAMALVDVLKATRLEPVTVPEIMEITGMGETMVRDILGVFTANGICARVTYPSVNGRPPHKFYVTPAWGGSPAPPPKKDGPCYTYTPQSPSHPAPHGL